MKKLLNDGANYVDEMLDGLCIAHPDYVYRDDGSHRVLLRAISNPAQHVGIVSGGGSGHMPLFHGYVGSGLLSSCAIGNVFAGPRVNDCVAAMRAANHGGGVMQVYGNYGGDRMNFDMARDILEMEGIEVATVRVTDDIASAPPDLREKRRGVAGIVYAYKVAGAIAARGASLAEVAAATQVAVDNCRSIGVALSPCVVPESGKPSFTIGEDEIEFGMGIHGEPGIWRGPMRSADSLSTEMLDMLLAELPVSSGDRVSVLVNSLGATPLEELYIVYRAVAARLKSLDVSIISPLVGRFATSMEMTGFSLSLLQLTDELESLLKAPADCLFWKV